MHWMTMPTTNPKPIWPPKSDDNDTTWDELLGRK